MIRVPSVHTPHNPDPPGIVVDSMHPPQVGEQQVQAAEALVEVRSFNGSDGIRLRLGSRQDRNICKICGSSTGRGPWLEAL